MTEQYRAGDESDPNKGLTSDALTPEVDDNATATDKADADNATENDGEADAENVDTSNLTPASESADADVQRLLALRNAAESANDMAKVREIDRELNQRGYR